MAATPAIATAFVQTIAPRANHLVVSKTKRVLELRHGEEILKRYASISASRPRGTRSALGRRPDARGTVLDRPAQSAQRVLSEHRDQLSERARTSRGPARWASIPGGDIFIHGEPMRDEEARGARLDRRLHRGDEPRDRGNLVDDADSACRSRSSPERRLATAIRLKAGSLPRLSFRRAAPTRSCRPDPGTSRARGRARRGPG